LNLIRKAVRNARNFACYYGDDGLEKLSRFDAVILAPHKQSEANVRQLVAAGTVTLAYLSVGEDSSEFTDGFERDWLEPESIEPIQFEPEWALREITGELVHNPVWGGVVVNLSHPGWTKTLFDRAKHALEMGFHGFFLDTIDRSSVADRRALTRIIRDLRTRWPGAPIMLNRGFELLPSVQDLVDGVVFESLSTTWILEAAQVKYARVTDETLEVNLDIAQQLRELGRSWELALWALDYTDSRELEAFSQATAKAFGFVSFTADRLLTRL
jgi:polysaccharide biosynthesis protein PelA